MEFPNRKLLKPDTRITIIIGHPAKVSHMNCAEPDVWHGLEPYVD